MRIVIAGDIKPASTAACPMISAPTIETVFPIDLGIRMVDSRKTSNAKVTTSASTINGRGTVPRLAATETINPVGKSPE